MCVCVCVFIQVIWNYINYKKITQLRFILNYPKCVGVGLNLVFLKDNQYDDPDCFSFFLKAEMVVHDIKTKI